MPWPGWTANTAKRSPSTTLANMAAMSTSATRGSQVTVPWRSRPHIQVHRSVQAGKQTTHWLEAKISGILGQHRHYQWQSMLQELSGRP